ncbi:MAG TPA: hypothetical protein VGW76_18315, partial [Pyrinomonadaceae bacterium]|nr:hypothetical protein [Pyrinomonadaceae bacterium]
SEGGVKLTLKLNADYTGSLNSDGFKYTVGGNRLLVHDNEGDSVYTFTLNGDALTISGGSLPRALTFIRQGGGGGGLFEKGLDKNADRPADAGAQEEDNGLVGLWKSYTGNSVTVQIFKDGKLTINGEPFRYQVDGRFITLTNNEGSARVEFQLDADMLTTLYQGERSTYRRVRRGSEPAEEGGGVTPAELTGKWCYMSNVTASNGGRMSNTCFTLYPNGTYDYYSETSSSNPYGGTASQQSDSGTWRVNGSTLIALSRARGRQTFTLEKRNHPKTGDPMLMVDGDAFVTYAPRAPWE